MIIIFLLATVGNAIFAADDLPLPPLNKNARIAVMPFVKGKDALKIADPANRTLRTPMSQLVYEKENFIETGPADLDRLLYNAVENHYGTRVIPQTLATDAYNKLSVSPDVDTPRKLARRLGKELGADLVVVGAVWRYREREGSAMSSAYAADVAFAVFVVDMKSGNRVWKGFFNKKQQNQSDNVTGAKEFYKQGGKWLTADELARYGMKKTMETFPEL